ncbi:MAG: deoxyribose-phosphate aldolase [Lachnospiraceae bacterium]|jgi:deoxyribose-phosphate aldolase
MDRKEILHAVDHTLLAQGATWEQIRQLMDDAIRFETASVCIPPSYVKAAKAYLGDRMRITTVIGFPNGYSTTAVKIFETQDVVNNGADEIDMVINIGWVKDARYDLVQSEIEGVRAACMGKTLKVIIETCLLTDDEKIRLCGVVTAAGADYIKTSTGFSRGGATFEDVELLRQHVGADVKVKASGGISSFGDAEHFMELGASRLGTSRLVKIAKQEMQ